MDPERIIWDDHRVEEFMEPEEGDYIISACGHLGGRTAVNVVGDRVRVEFDDEVEAEAWIEDRMAQEHFYPSIWSLSDHGNFTPYA